MLQNNDNLFYMTHLNVNMIPESKNCSRNFIGNPSQYFLDRMKCLQIEMNEKISKNYNNPRKTTNLTLLSLEQELCKAIIYL